MSQEERSKLDSQTSAFTLQWASELSTLRKYQPNCNRDRDSGGVNNSTSSKAHYQQVISFLLEVVIRQAWCVCMMCVCYHFHSLPILFLCNDGKILFNICITKCYQKLQCTSKCLQTMQRQRIKYSSQSPFKLTTRTLSPRGSNSSGTSTRSSIGRTKTPSTLLTPTANNNTAAPAPAPINISMQAAAVAAAPPLLQVADGFSDRYESELGPPKKLKEYQRFVAKHKDALLVENKQLKAKFSEDLIAAESIEGKVADISGMLSEFGRLLQSQSESVQDMHGTSKEATEHVQQTDDELLTTIERSKSYQRNIFVAIVVLAFILLLLDFMTP